MSADVAGASPASPAPPKRYVPAVVRFLMGLAFFVFGLNGFLHFMPEPKTEMPKAVTDLMTGMMGSGYMFPLIFGTQLVVGVLLLLNIFVPLALALIAPVLVNIIVFHIRLQPSGIVPGAILTVFELYLAWCYRKCFFPMLAFRVRPGG